MTQNRVRQARFVSAEPRNIDIIQSSCVFTATLPLPMPCEQGSYGRMETTHEVSTGCSSCWDGLGTVLRRTHAP
eukprot:6188313-Pleurochrysis_carterae.AAC.3